MPTVRVWGHHARSRDLVSIVSQGWFFLAASRTSLPNIIALNGTEKIQKIEYVPVSRLHNDISTWLLHSVFLLNCTIWRKAPASVAAPQRHYNPRNLVFQHNSVAPASVPTVVRPFKVVPLAGGWRLALRAGGNPVF